MRRDDNGSAILVLGIALYFLALPARALAGASVLEPPPAHARASITGMHFGFWASSSRPGQYLTNDYDPGLKGGMALTWIRGRSTGFGVAVDYGRWRSPAAGAELDQLFSIFSGTEIRGTEISMSGIRGTIRLTEWLESSAPVAPWIQVGVGACRLSRKTELPVQQLLDSGWQVNGSGGINISYQPVFMGGMGLDWKTSPTTRIGFDVMGEALFIGDQKTTIKKADEIVGSLTIGGHVLFGRWAAP